MAYRLMLLLLGLAFTLPAATPAHAANPITVLEDSAQTNWPENITFTLRLRATAEITRLRIEYWYTGNTRAAGNPTFTPASEASAQFVLRTRGAQDVPPGALITYRYTIEDAAGNTLRTEPKQYRFLDTRYRWQEAQNGLITVLTNEATQARAQAILQAAVTTIATIKEQAGVTLDDPLTVVAYRTTAELDSAYPPRSLSTHGTRAGVAVSGFNVVLVTTEGDAVGTTAHEVTHAVVEATVGPGAISAFPMWLNEGLATYFQPSRGAEWTQYLQQAVRADRVMPLRFLRGYPGKEEEWLLVYAQGVSMVKFLLNTYGPEKMGALLRAYRDGDTDERTFERVYGKPLSVLENEWRQSLGLKPLASPQGPSLGGEPQPIPTLPPLTIEQSPGGRQPVPTPAPSGAASPANRAPLAFPLPLLAAGAGAVVVLLVIVVGVVALVRRNSL
jgi:hypothetical protein